MRLLTPLFIAIAWIAPSQTWGAPGRFGPEFEFHNTRQMIDSAYTYWRGMGVGQSEDANEAALYKLRDAYEKVAASRGFEVQYSDYSTAMKFPRIEITYPDGFSFTLKTDIGVIEVVTEPATLETFEKNQARLEKDLFQFLNEKGFKPGKGFGLGNGHINIDFESVFGRNMKLFRNFIVDYYNHYELISGLQISAWDKMNAISIAQDPREYTRFIRYIQLLDEGQINRVSRAASWLFNSVYNGDKFRALNLWDRDEGQRIEIRALRSQSSAAEFIHIARLFEKRIEYLKTQTHVKLLPREEILGRKGWISGYRKYVEESGLEWKTYRELMPFLLRCKSLLLPSRDLP